MITRTMKAARKKKGNGRMDVYAAIATRRTIRDFEDRAIDPSLIERLICAGTQAPTNNHMREWHFVVLADRQQRADLIGQVIKPVGRKGAIGIVNRWQMTDLDQREMYIDAIPKQASMLIDTGCLILPFYHQTSPLLKPKTLSDLNAFASIWCCVENILIAAAAEGIFGVTRIPFDEERQTVKRILNVPDGYEFPCYLSLGYPGAEVFRARQVEVPLDERIHHNVW